MRGIKQRVAHTIGKTTLCLLGKLRDPNRNLVVIGGMNGALYGDNSRHLYEWILRNRPDLYPVWLTKNQTVYNTLKEQGKPVALMASWAGITYLAHARIGVFTNSLHDLALSPFIIPDTLRLIALRHGKSVKRVRFARVEHKISPKEAIERSYESKLIYYAISTSEFISDIQEESLQIGRQKHIVTGYPRNDVLLSPTGEMQVRWERYLNGLNPTKIVLYAPSWRHGRERTRFFPFPDFDSDDLTTFLKHRRILLLLRPHLNDFSRYPDLRAFLDELAAGSDFIRVASHEVFPDVSMVLPFMDTLISDYSSLYHDFLLLDRPLMFIPYDYEDFARKNGFHYDYFEYLPGPAVDTFSDFCYQLDQIYQETDVYQQKRRKLSGLIHTYQDSSSCERVTALIDKIRHEDRKE